MKRLFAATLVTTALTALPAMAGTFTYNGYSLDGQSVTITPPGEVVGAGIITLDGAGADVGAFLRAMCVDISDTLLSSDTYTFVPPPGPLTPTEVGQIGGLLDFAFANSGNTDDTAGAQLAMWDILFPSDTFTGSIGANAVAASLLTSPPTPDTNIQFLEDAPAVPNQILVTPGLPTLRANEPATLGLLGFGLLALWGFNRRRQTSPQRRL